jgi:hypothetical protein
MVYLRIPLKSADLAACGRLWSDAEGVLDEEWLWLRAPSCDSPWQELFRGVPGCTFFDLVKTESPAGLLQQWGARLPSSAPPQGSWRSLRELFPVHLPPAGFPAAVPETVPIQLRRTAVERPAVLLVAAWSDWEEYSLPALETRLSQWRFAREGGGRVVIAPARTGAAVAPPPIPGQQYWGAAGVYLPLGYETDPACEPDLLSRLLRVAPGDVCLWQVEGAVERIAGEDFTLATRAAIRASAGD